MIIDIDNITFSEFDNVFSSLDVLIYTNNYSVDLYQHVDIIYNTLSNIRRFKYKKCISCFNKKNIKEFKICSDCRNYNLIKTTVNNITKILPIEIINYIHNFF